MIKDLRTYLTENKVEHLHSLFEKLGIDESQLLAKLKYSDLEKIGIENLIERRKVFDIINEINQDMYTEEIETNENDFTDIFGAKSHRNSGSLKTTGIYEGSQVYPETSQPHKNRLEKALEEFSSPNILLDGGKSIFGGYGMPMGQKLVSHGTPKRDSFEKHLFNAGDADVDDNSLVLELSNASSTTVSNSLNEPSHREGKITVCVRKKPCNRPELDIVEVEGRGVIVNESKFRVDLKPYTEQHRFVFDHSFDGYKKNIDIYRESVRDIVDHVVGGGFGTILAYGQTGTGKTYTMLEKDIGMIYMAIKDLLTSKKQGTITFCEIYMGQVHDLLDDAKKIQLREVNGVVHLANSREIEFKTFKEAFDIINKGLSLRKTGVTGANLKSSRSHAVILVNFFEKKMVISQKKFQEQSFERRNAGSIIFVDLAGSERGSDRKDVGLDTKNEGAEINKSLLALKECIRGIEKDQKHLPFRQSKLTQILKNSFVGASKTCLIATISPIFENIEHTLNTLRYASRIKEGSLSEVRTSDMSNSSISQAKPHAIGSSKKKMPFNGSLLDSTCDDSRRKDVALQEIKKILVCIEKILPSLQTSEDLERMLSLCKDLEGKMNFKAKRH